MSQGRRIGKAAGPSLVHGNDGRSSLAPPSQKPSAPDRPRGVAWGHRT